jgi:hypothetical protein
VSFAGGAQAQNESHRAGLEIRLIRVRNDGRIEQRRRLQRVLRQKVRADQQFSFAGKPLHR